MADEKLRIQLQLDGSGQVTAALKGVKGGLSDTQASVITLNQAFDLVSRGASIFRTVAAGAKELIDQAGGLGELAARIGLNVEALQEYQFAAQQAGVAQDQLQSSLQIFTKRVGEAQLGTGELVTGLKSHNLALLENVRGAGSMEQALDLAFQALGNERDAARQAALANTLFGRSGQALIPILSDGVGGLEAMRAKARELGLVLDKDMVDQLDATSDKMDELSEVVRKNLTAALVELTPEIISAADAFETRFPAAIRAAIDAGREWSNFVNVGLRINEINEEFGSLAEASARFEDLLEQQLALKKASDLSGAGSLATQKLHEVDAEIERLRVLLGVQEDIRKSEANAGAEKSQKHRETLAALDSEKSATRELARAEKEAADERNKAIEEAISGIKLRVEAEDDLAKMIRDSQREATLSMLNEGERRGREFEFETEDRLEQMRLQAEAAGKTEAEITGLLEGERQRRTEVWEGEQRARVESARQATLNLGQIVDRGIDDITQAIRQGTLDWEDVLQGFGDIAISVFVDWVKESIKAKLGLDQVFKANIFDLGSILPGLFEDGLNSSGGSVLGNLLGGGSGGGGLAGLLVGGGGAAGGGLLGSKVGGTGGAIVGAVLGKILAEQGLSVATSGALSAGTVPALSSTIGTAGIDALINAGVVHLAADQSGNIVLALGPGPSSVTISGGSAGASIGGSAIGTALGRIAPYAGLGLGIYSGVRALSGPGSSDERGIEAGHQMGIAVTSFFNPLLGGIIKLVDTVLQSAFGKTFGQAIGGAFGLGPSSGALSRRFLGNEILGGTTAIGGLGDTLNFDPYKSGITSVAKAMQAFPDLFAKAGNAATAFGVVLAQSVDSGQSDTKELNYVVETLIDNLGTAGVDGQEGVVRIAAAMRELGITTDQAGAAIQQAFQQGKLGFNEYAQAMAGLDELTGVTTDQMVEILKAGLNDEAAAVFDRLRQVGVDAFQAIMLAGNEAFLGVAATLTDDMLPNAAAVFNQLRELGVSAADDVRRAWEGIGEGGRKTPDTPSQFFVGADSGKLFFGHYSKGVFYPEPAPFLTDAEQQATRKTAPKIQGLARGGFVEGALNEPRLIMAHGGEYVTAPGQPGGLTDLILMQKQTVGLLAEVVHLLGVGDTRVAGSIDRLQRSIGSRAFPRGLPG